jgi:phage/plasmid-associated DNA primase
MNPQTHKSTPTGSQNQSPGSSPERVPRLLQLLGKNTVLLPIFSGEKRPSIPKWQEQTLEAMDSPDYLASLEKGNIGVMLGAASGHLVSIDCDTDDAAAEMLKLNPMLAGTLRTRGARGCNFWLRILDGIYPKTTKLKDSLGKSMGEFRATGGQTVISGKHPSGCEYSFLIEAPPVCVSFEEIVWPDTWQVPFRNDLFDQLVQFEGSPITVGKGGGVQVNRPFFARLLMTEEKLGFDIGTCQFRQYDPASGVWAVRSAGWVDEKISALVKRVADDLGYKRLECARTMALIGDIRMQVRNKSGREFHRTMKNILHVRNGMLEMGGSGKIALREFNPDYFSTHQLDVEFNESAKCPVFLNEFLAPILSQDDIALLQKIMGMILVEKSNVAQRIGILEGASGSGKSILSEVTEFMLGSDHCAELRTKHLGDRFESAAYLGKSLLCGKDVDGNFLCHEGASELKSLTGGGQKEAEIKGQSQKCKYEANFNVLISCNGRLRIRLDGDADAWERRILIIHYPAPMATPPQPGFSKWLFDNEGSGILNWAILGYYRLLEDIGKSGTIQLSTNQRNRVLDLIEGSDCAASFVTKRLTLSKGSSLTSEELFEQYVLYCKERNWRPITDHHFKRRIEGEITTHFGISKSHSILRDGTHRNGFSGIGIKREESSVD